MLSASKENNSVDYKQKSKTFSLEEENLDVGKILNKFGRFQYQSLLQICPSYAMVAVVVISHVFLNVTPDHICRPQLLTELSTNIFQDDISLISNLNFTGVEKMRCSRWNTSNPNITEAFESRCLNGWAYDVSSAGNTIVSQFDLVCEFAWRRPFTISSMMSGFLIGSLFGGQVPDRFGRRKSSLFAFTIHTLIEAILSFSPNYWFYVSFLFLEGIALSISYINLYVWALEFVSSGDKRSLTAFGMSVAFGGGGMIMSLIAFLITDWYWIYRTFVIISCVICFPMLYFVPESPTWLLQIGNTKDCQEVLMKIAAMNKVDIGTNKSAFSMPVITVTWLIGFLAYNTMTYNSANLGGNIYIDNLIGCALDTGSVFMTTAILKKCSRKTTLTVTWAAVAVFSFLSPLTKQENLIAGVAFAQLGRLFATGATWVLLLYNGEIFPTLLRNTSLGVCNVSGRIGSIASPFLVFIGEVIDLSIPFYVLGGISLLAISLILLLPDAPQNFLPNTVADALALKDGISAISCKTRKRQPKKIAETQSQKDQTLVKQI